MKKFKLEIKPLSLKDKSGKLLSRIKNIFSRKPKNGLSPSSPSLKLNKLHTIRIKFIKSIANSFVGRIMTHWKIGQKIFFGYLLLLASLFLVGGACLINLSRLSSQYEDVLSRNIPAIQAVEHLESELVGLDNCFKSYLIDGNAKWMEEANNYLNDMVTIIGDCRNYALTPQEVESAEKLRGDYEEYQATVALCLGKLQTGDKQGAIETMATITEAAKQKLLNNNKVLIESNNKAMEKAAKKVQDIRFWTLIITSLLVVLSTLIGLFMAIYLPISIVKPINELVKSSQKIAEGDLTSTIDVKSTDEIGELSKVFNQMVYNLKSLLFEVTSSTEQVAFSSEQLQIVTEETSKTATSISSSIQDIANGSEDADKAVSDVSSTITQVSGGIQQIASNAQVVTSVSKKASEHAQVGNQALHNAIKQMNSISRTVNNSAEVIKVLGQRTAAIGQISDVITNIADQTQLLSLNASIEAARAGDRGRGFAVVAEEVKKLADQSASHAKEIASLIEEIQKETDRAVEAMEAGTTEVMQGMQVMEHADKSFRSILEAIDDVTRQIEEVSTSTEQMASSTNQVVDSMFQISKITELVSEGTQNIAAAAEQQTASMQQIAGSADSLSEMADHLKEQVQKFKTQ